MEYFWIGVAVGFFVGEVVMWAYFANARMLRSRQEWTAAQDKTHNPCDVGEV